MTGIGRRRAELAAALLLLTRLPTGWIARAPAGLADSVWAFPLVGGLVGLLGGGVFWLGTRLGLPSALAALWALVAMAVATGALHEDGLADTADGFGGGRTRERKLEIMRDSRIGTFGALALLFALAIRGAAIAAIASPGAVAAALLVAGSLGRAAILLVLATLAPARADGMASGLAGPRRGRTIVGLALASAVALALLPPATAIATLAAASAAALAMAWSADRQIGGYTGDVLGATAVASELIVLTLLAAG